MCTDGLVCGMYQYVHVFILVYKRRGPQQKGLSRVWDCPRRSCSSISLATSERPATQLMYI